MTETRWVGISRAVFSVFVGCLTVLIAMASDILFWGFAGWPGKLRAKIGESLIEGAAIGILFWLWRTQVTFGSGKLKPMPATRGCVIPKSGSC